MTTSQAEIDRLKAAEGFRATMYHDAAGLPTIGYGTLIDTASEAYLLSATITPEQGEELLRTQLGTYEQAVRDSITVPLAQGQFDALVSLAYNIGPNALKSGSLPGLINSHASPEAISAKWKEYRIAGGQVSQGLVNRRAAELQVYWQHLWQIGCALLLIAALLLGGAAYTTLA